MGPTKVDCVDTFLAVRKERRTIRGDEAEGHVEQKDLLEQIDQKSNKYSAEYR